MDTNCRFHHCTLVRPFHYVSRMQSTIHDDDNDFKMQSTWVRCIVCASNLVCCGRALLTPIWGMMEKAVSSVPGCARTGAMTKPSQPLSGYDLQLSYTGKFPEDDSVVL